jgi:hypothetical protein
VRKGWRTEVRPVLQIAALSWHSVPVPAEAWMLPPRSVLPQQVTPTSLTSSLTTQWRKDPFTFTLVSAVKAALTSGPHWRSPCGGLAVDSRAAQVACTWFYTWQDAAARLQSAGPAAQLLPVTFAFYCLHSYFAFLITWQTAALRHPPALCPSQPTRGVLAVPVHQRCNWPSHPWQDVPSQAHVKASHKRGGRYALLQPGRERQPGPTKIVPSARCECSSGTGKSDRTCVAALGSAGSS